MNLLILSPALPLPFGSTDARWLHSIVGEAGRRGHSVRCVSCTEEPQARVEEAIELTAEAGAVLRHIPLRVPGHALVRKAGSLLRPSAEFARVPELRDVLSEELRRPVDVVHVEHLFPAWALLGDPRLVVFVHQLDVVDWEDRTGLSPRERWELLQMRRATRALLRRAPRVVTTTDRLKRAIEARSSTTRVGVVPIVLDPGRYTPGTAPQGGPVVGVIGSMHWYPSRSAAERVLTRLWPEIHHRVPSARLLVGGWNAQRYLGHHFPLPGAELMQRIDHPADFFGSVHALLYPPPKGTGMKVKVMEAMAYGVPVVSNTEGLEGLDCVDGVHAMQAETDTELIERTVVLLEDAEKRRAMAENGRQLVATAHEPGIGLDRLLNAYEKLFA